MNYFVYRNQQEYGPYSLSDLQTYVANGSLSASDQVRNDKGGPWTILSQLLQPAAQPAAAAPAPPVVQAQPEPVAYVPPAPVPPAPAAYVPPAEPTPAPYVPPAPAAPAAYAPPAPAAPAPLAVAPTPVYVPPSPGAVPLPPNLHWGVVLLIGLLFNPFLLVWIIIQMVWVRKIDRQNRSLLYYLIALGGLILFMVIGVVALLADSDNPGFLNAIPFLLAWFLGLFFGIKAIFGVRKSMVTYYNTVEPIGLRMSGAMTFFFSVYYFQYHMTRIVLWKTTGVLTPQT
jgi:hypothetical protein